MKTGLVNPVRRSLLVGAGVAAAFSSLGGTRAIAGTSGAARLFFTEAGAGKNVLLLHGWTADSTDWLWQLPALERRYRVVAVDLRGHGRSEIMPSGTYAPDDYLADIPAEMEPAFSKTAADLQRGDPRSAAAGLFELVYDPATDPAYRRWHARRLLGMPEHVVRESFGPLFQGADQVGLGIQSEIFCRTLSTPVYHLCRDPVQASRMAQWFSHRQSKVDYWSGAGHWIMQDRSAPVNSAVIDWIDALD